MEVSGQISLPGLFTPGKRPRYPVDRRLDRLQSRSECGAEEKKSLPRPLRESNPSRSARNQVTVLSEHDRILVICVCLLFLVSSLWFSLLFMVELWCQVAVIRFLVGVLRFIWKPPDTCAEHSPHIAECSPLWSVRHLFESYEKITNSVER